jgi:uncharacterized phage protein gp47/JayE
MELHKVSLSSNVPQVSFTNVGVIIPDETAPTSLTPNILDGVLSDIDNAFGGGLNQSLTTPQGQLASSISAIIADKNNQILNISNQLDPQYADGRFQDAIGRYYYLTRKPSTATTAICTVTGLNGTVLPAGVLAQDTNGNTYASTSSVTIVSGNTATVEFQNIVSGSIPCADNSLTIVYQSIPGWDSVTNGVGNTVIGSNLETRAEFEERRQLSVAINAHGSVESIYGAVLAVTNVTDAYVMDNPTSSTQSVGSTNYNLQPHSLYVAAVGGADIDVATAIISKKDVGCDYNGNTNVNVPVAVGGIIRNFPVIFERPASLPIYFLVTILNSPFNPSNIATLIQNAIIARFAGLDDTNRERIGSTIYAARYYSIAVPNMKLVSINVGISASPSTGYVQVGIDQTPTLSSSNITVNMI